MAKNYPINFCEFFCSVNTQDLDDTLYPGGTGIGPALKRNIDEFLVARFSLVADKAAAVRVELFRTYGSTLAGLIVRRLNPHAHSTFTCFRF